VLRKTDFRKGERERERTTNAKEKVCKNTQTIRIKRFHYIDMSRNETSDNEQQLDPQVLQAIQLQRDLDRAGYLGSAGLPKYVFLLPVSIEDKGKKNSYLESYMCTS